LVKDLCIFVIIILRFSELTVKQSNVKREIA